MKHRIGRTSHRDIECHRIEESLPRGDAPWQYALVAVAVIFIGILHNQPCRIFEKNPPVDVGSQYRAVARQSQSDSLVQAVHRVGGKHTRAASASRAGMAFNLCHIGIAHACIRRFNHRVNQVEMHPAPFACFHRTTRYKNRRDIEPHSRHQHTRRNLVAIRDAHHRVHLVRVDHVFDAVGDDIARRQ